MNVLALVSGGKDSILAIHLAEAVMGHKVRGVVHFKPRGGAEETDSYMFQSVGSSCMDSIGCALDVPYFATTLVGKSLATDSEYTFTPDDEIEDLKIFLRQVLGDPRLKTASIAGIVTGAIWSRYQKRRVEYVCTSLGLKSIAPLWAKNQNAYLLELHRMSDEFDFRIIKTAALGLDKTHLLKSFGDDDLIRKLISLYHLYQINVGGEGGEFESLTLKAPLYPKAFSPIDVTKVQDRDVAFARFKVVPVDCRPHSSYIDEVRKQWLNGSVILKESGYALANCELFDCKGAGVAYHINKEDGALVLSDDDTVLEYSESESLSYRCVGTIAALVTKEGNVKLAPCVPHVEFCQIGCACRIDQTCLVSLLRNYANLSGSVCEKEWRRRMGADPGRAPSRIVIRVPEGCSLKPDDVKKIALEFQVANVNAKRWTGELSRCMYSRYRALGLISCAGCLAKDTSCDCGDHELPWPFIARDDREQIHHPWTISIETGDWRLRSDF